jgi:hypothetical protein
MRRHLFRALLIFVAILAALLVWLWASDFVLIDKCQDAGGAWDKQARICRIDLNSGPPAPASPRR